MRRFCFRRMWSIPKQHTFYGEQKRRAAVYREAPGPDLGSTVGFRSPRFPRHAALDRTRAGYEPVPLEQPHSAEGVRLTRRADQPATEGRVACRSYGGGSTGALSGLV